MCGRGAKLDKPKLTGKADRTKKGSRVWLKLAIGLKSDVRYFEAALYRLKGELTLLAAKPAMGQPYGE